MYLYAYRAIFFERFFSRAIELQVANQRRAYRLSRFASRREPTTVY